MKVNKLISKTLETQYKNNIIDQIYQYVIKLDFQSWNCYDLITNLQENFSNLINKLINFVYLKKTFKMEGRC